MSRTSKGQFAPGNSGRPAGSRNRLQADLLKTLADDYRVHGAGVVRIVRTEKPVEYLKIVASVLPKEFLFTETPLGGMSDEEIDAALTAIRNLGGETESDGETTH